MRSGVLAAAGAALLLAGALAAVPYPEGPPPGHTGGFGEPTCLVCHAGEALNPAGGSLALEGVPETYAPGRRYPLTVRLSHPELGRAGFQLSARFAAGDVRGGQAGELAGGPEGGAADRESAAGAAGGAEGAGPRVAVTPGADGRIRYAHQTREGSEVRGTAAEWRVVWTAPACASAPVAFHLAANAGNDDVSEFGDRVYAVERTSAPDPGR